MSSVIRQLDTAHTQEHRDKFFAPAFISSIAGLFNILPSRAVQARRTPEDDARNLHGDLARVGQDFSRVMSTLFTAPNE